MEPRSCASFGHQTFCVWYRWISMDAPPPLTWSRATRRSRAGCTGSQGGRGWAPPCVDTSAQAAGEGQGCLLSKGLADTSTRVAGWGLRLGRLDTSAQVAGWGQGLGHGAQCTCAQQRKHPRRPCCCSSAFKLVTQP